MTLFIHLSRRIINKSYIKEIVKGENKYYIHLNSIHFAGINIFGLGHISSNNTIIEICEKEDKRDYDIMTQLFPFPTKVGNDDVKIV